MAPRRTGTVKPPVIDLTARPADTPDIAATPAEPEAAPVEEAVVAPAPAAAEKPVERPEAPQEKPVIADAPDAPLTEGPTPVPPAPASPFLMLAAAIGGGALGALLAYLLALGGLWPSTQPEIVDPAPAIARLETDVSTLRSNIQAAADAAAAAGAEARAATEAVTNIPAGGESVDLAPIETEIADLRSQIATLAGNDGATSPETVQAMADMSARLGDIDSKLSALTERVGANETSLAEATAEPETPTPDPVPTALDNLETAFLSGRPYTTALLALTTARPQTVVPDALVSSAATGLVAPDILSARYAEMLPAILAARPVAADGDWQATAFDWLKAMLAIRPAGEVAGDDPDAVISRLDAAMARKDYRAAGELIAALPEPMRAVAAPLAADIAAQAEAAAFLESQRSALLTTQTGATN